MSTPTDLAGLPTWMAEAFTEHGFTALTPIQRAVLAEETAGRDLRLSSATGSGKTVAVAMAVASEVERACAPPGDDRPEGATVLVIAPTRELATQLRGELQWIYGGLRARAALVLGGAAYGPELRSLRRRPTILVGTPGRLLDHVRKGNADLSGVQTVVLDEADQLLELGFKEELDAILEACPTQRRTLLVSATFSAPVRALAKRHQRDALVVEGTPTGGQHADIAYRVHPIAAADQLAALINILLSAPPGAASSSSPCAHRRATSRASSRDTASTRPHSAARCPRPSVPVRWTPSALDARASWWPPTWPRAASTCRKFEPSCTRARRATPRRSSTAPDARGVPASVAPVS